MASWLVRFFGLTRSSPASPPIAHTNATVASVPANAPALPPPPPASPSANQNHHQHNQLLHQREQVAPEAVLSDARCTTPLKTRTNAANSSGSASPMVPPTPSAAGLAVGPPKSPLPLRRVISEPMQVGQNAKRLSGAPNTKPNPTPLITAAHSGDLHAVRQLLHNPAIDSKTEVARVDVMGWTALHHACFNGHTDVRTMVVVTAVEPVTHARVCECVDCTTPDRSQCRRELPSQTRPHASVLCGSRIARCLRPAVAGLQRRHQFGR